MKAMQLLWAALLCSVLGGISTRAAADSVRSACPPPASDCNSNGLDDAFDSDCNADGIADDCQTLDDCNANGVPDACESAGARARAAAEHFFECVAGPLDAPPVASGAGCACEAVYDLDADADVDLADYALLQRATAEVPPRWWNAHWRYRIPLTIGSAGWSRTDYPAEVEVNFSAALQTLGVTAAFAPDTLRVIEVNTDGVPIDEQVAFQFDSAPDYDADSNALGTLVVLLTGTTAASASRHYEVYFDTAGAGLPPACFAAQVLATDGVWHEGQSSIRVETQIGAWYYHKQGAGFASLDDVEGRDWIGYHPGGGASGEYRGIPNGGPFHPGYTDCTSVLESNGPLRARIRSASNDGQWESTWDIYPRFATFTMLRIAEPYWILYEGTPYGALEKERDFVARSSGEVTSVSVSWFGDISAPEWVYFGDTATQRILYLAHHSDDDASDQFWHMQAQMTVFGFGRQYQCCDAYLTAVPDRFTVGLGEVAGFAQAEQLIESTWRGLAVELGPPGAVP